MDTSCYLVRNHVPMYNMIIIILNKFVIFIVFINTTNLLSYMIMMLNIGT